MKVGDQFKDSGKIVVITNVKNGYCWYKPVERWDNRLLDVSWSCSVGCFEEYVRTKCYHRLPDKSDNFTSLYDKLRGQ